MIIIATIIVSLSSLIILVGIFVAWMDFLGINFSISFNNLFEEIYLNDNVSFV